MATSQNVLVATSTANRIIAAQLRRGVDLQAADLDHEVGAAVAIHVALILDLDSQVGRRPYSSSIASTSSPLLIVLVATSS